MKSRRLQPPIRGAVIPKRWAAFDDLSPFFTAAPAGLVILDSRLQILRANEEMANILGSTVPEILGETPREVAPLLAPTIEPILLKVISTGESNLNFRVNGETPKSPGILRDWLASVFPMPHPKNQKPRIGAIAVEVTGQVRFDRMSKDHALLTHAEEMARLGSWEHDCATGDELWSANLCRILGRSDLEGKLPESEFWEALHPDDRPMVRDIIQRAMLEKQPYEYRARFTLPDGREHLLYTRAELILNSENQVVRRSASPRTSPRKFKPSSAYRPPKNAIAIWSKTGTDLICTHDLHGRLLSMNDRPARLLGYRPEASSAARSPICYCLSIATSSLPTSPPSAAKVKSKVSSPFTPMPANAALGYRTP